MSTADFWIWQTDVLWENAERIQRSFAQAWVGTFTGLPDGMKSWAQPINIVECADAVWVISALAGVEPQEMEVRLEGNELVIQGHRAVPECCLEGELRVWEIPFGRFERRLRFVGSALPTLGETRLERGLLFIQLLRKK
jgi:HSP20 family molecular chaperone IbpA